MYEALLFTLVGVLAFLGGLAIPLFLWRRRQKEIQAQLEEAKREAARLRQEALLSAQREIQEMRAREEQRLRRWEEELNQLEERLRQREDRLGKKSHYLEMVEDALRRDEAELERLIEMGQKLLAEERELLEKLSGFTQEEAKEYLLPLVEAESE
ncbi:MAG: Rnase Y domain-containing protein, partial [Candidatus Bipolaricaulaceae bacterium]